jgi:thiol-disulfide isomerase/thioredoxin
MKNIYSATIIFLIIFCFVSCKSKELVDQKIKISGQIKDYNKNDSQKIIGFNFQTLENIKNDTKIAQIDANGKFQIETSIAWPQDFYFEYGFTRFYMICSPGDNLIVEIDNAIWNEPTEDKTKFLSIVGGSAKNDNKYVNTFIFRVHKLLFKTTPSQNVKSCEPIEYKEFILSQKKEALKSLHELKDSVNTTLLFDKWAENYINHATWSNLLHYRMFHPIHNGIDRLEFKMPEDYYALLNDYSMDNYEVISTSQEYFYHVYSMYLDEFLPLDSLKKHQETYETDVISYYSSEVKQRAKYTNGFTSDVFIYEIYSRMIDWSLIEELEAIYQPDIFNHEYFSKKLEAKLTQIKKHIDNPNFADNLNLMSNDNQIVEQLLDTITLKYQDKVLYIDFWSPSCGPCLREMSSSKKLQKEYKNKDVAFLYLASSCKEDAWKAKISEKQLSGEHLLLTKDQFRVMKQLFGVNSIPHYVLIDKNRNVILKNAPRPSSNAIKSEIDKLLRN